MIEFEDRLTDYSLKKSGYTELTGSIHTRSNHKHRCSSFLAALPFALPEMRGVVVRNHDVSCSSEGMDALNGSSKESLLDPA